MAIKAVIDKIEDVDEKYRDLYTAKADKFELTGVEGMRTEADVTRLSGALEKERTDHKGTKKKYEALGDRKVEDVLVQLDRIPELEMAAKGKLDEKQIDEIVEKRINSKTAPLERKVKELTGHVVERDTLIAGYQSKEQTRIVQDAIKEAIGKAQGFQTAAVEDALLFGEKHLTINEDGKVVSKDGVGVTPGIDAVVWLTEMQTRKPHWWGETSGGGAGGNKGGGAGGARNPWTFEHWNVTEQGQIYNTNVARAEQLAKSAGHAQVLGARKPVPKAK